MTSFYTNLLKRQSVAALLFFTLLACGHENSAEGVAEEFLFRYFIELNQSGALELSTGLAVQKLKKEMELLRSVRMQPDLELAKRKPFLDYEMVNSQARNDHSVTFFYDVTIEMPNSKDAKRQVILTATVLEGVWKVDNYDTFVRTN